MLKRTLLLIVSLLIISCTACEKGKPDSQKTPIQAAFDEFTESVFYENITSNTINLHYTLAYPENYDLENKTATLGDFGYDYMLEEASHIETLAKKLKDFPYDELTAEQQLTYDILEDALKSELTCLDYIYYTEALSPLTGYQAQLPILLANYTFRCKEDVDNYLALLENFDEYFAKIIEFEALKSEKGYFMPDFMATDVIAQCEAFIKNIENNYLIETFNSAVNELSFLTEAEKNSYREKNVFHVANDVASAYRIIIDGLSSLSGTGTNDAGLYYYVDGNDYYSYLVRSATGSDKSVDALQVLTAEYIEDSLQDIYSLMISDATLVDELSEFTFSVSEPTEILEYLKKAINEDFPTLPDTTCRVLSVHESMEENLSPAFFLVPPIDDTYNNVIYINNYYSNSNLFTTLAHEGYPGHLYQNVYAAHKSLPLVRNMLNYPGYTEGWATYAEYYSYYLCGFSDNLARVLVLNDSATLGIYAYLDMAIHDDGWLYEDVCEYLKIFGLNDAEIALEIYEMIIENPAEYLSYFIGFLEITQLKEKAVQMLGDEFTLKKFHTFLLDIGPAPYDIIEKYMEKSFTKQPVGEE